MSTRSVTLLRQALIAYKASPSQPNEKLLELGRAIGLCAKSMQAVEESEDSEFRISVEQQARKIARAAANQAAKMMSLTIVQPKEGIGAGQRKSAPVAAPVDDSFKAAWETWSQFCGGDRRQERGEGRQSGVGGMVTGQTA